MLDIYISLSHIPTHLLPYLPLYRECLFDLPVIRCGARLGHEDVARALEGEASTYWASFTSIGGMLRVGLEVERAEYAAGIAWLKDVLYGAVFDVARCVHADPLDYTPPEC